MAEKVKIEFEVDAKTGDLIVLDKRIGKVGARLKKTKKAAKPDKTRVIICAGSGCLAYGTQTLIDSFKDEIEKQNLQDERAMVLKEARSRATEGMFLAASKLYKQAAKLSNKLGDFKAEELYNKNYHQFLQKERAAVLKDARNHAAEGRFQAAAQSYKQAAILSNKLGDRQEESQHNKKARQLLAKSKK